jgi:hypothetical protein
VTVSVCGYAAQVQSCYEQTAAYCALIPGSASLTDIYFKNFKGTTSTSYEPVIANIDCPPDDTCEVYFSGWSVGHPQAQQNTYVPTLAARLESLVQAMQLDELLVLYSWVRVGL